MIYIVYFVSTFFRIYILSVMPMYKCISAVQCLVLVVEHLL